MSHLEIEFLPAQEVKKEDTPQPPEPVTDDSWIWSLLFWLVIPPLALYRKLLVLWVKFDLRWIHDKKASHYSKCPGCGTREFHPFQFAEDYERLIHTCPDCKAEWGEKPVVPFSRWKIARTLEKEPEENPTGII